MFSMFLFKVNIAILCPCVHLKAQEQRQQNELQSSAEKLETGGDLCRIVEAVSYIMEVYYNRGYLRSID